jgi:hypothetical protein
MSHSCSLSLFLSDQLSNEQLILAVKNWLQNRADSAWILVLDGLDTENTYFKLRQFCPTMGTGQLLINTKDCAVLCPFTGLKSCLTINIEALGIKDAQQMLLSLIEATTEDIYYTPQMLAPISYTHQSCMPRI